MGSYVPFQDPLSPKFAGVNRVQFRIDLHFCELNTLAGSDYKAWADQLSIQTFYLHAKLLRLGLNYTVLLDALVKASMHMPAEKDKVVTANLPLHYNHSGTH